ncbi:protein SOB FIVE-LIKE 5-like isoform X2 [Euphorbia lathyris]|uniref:protein SOB FIVE-LIKE 5-like isoform X2 n=1 Tax=Euphorbia lathyris TaxID=212925 RepID=UPI00331361DC
MNAFASECTSGCESGWTLYLEQSFLSPATTSSRMVDITIAAGNFCGKKETDIQEQQQQEDDLSMLSDASSGPPHFNEDETYFNFDNNVGGGGGGGRKSCGGKRRKERVKSRSEKQEAVDDTASSPAFNLSKSNFILPNNNNPDYSQDFSATHFEGRSAYQAQFGYVQPSQSGNQLQNNQWY